MQKNEEKRGEGCEGAWCGGRIVEVNDIEEIVKRGVMSRPSLVIKGEVKSPGRMLSPEQITRLLQDYLCGEDVKLTVVLNGGLRSCCSMYPTELIVEVLRSWLGEDRQVEVIDRQRGRGEPGRLEELALKHFGESAYPFIYADDELITLG